VLENFTFDTLIESYKRTHANAYNQWLSVKWENTWRVAKTMRQ
jgi:hypothetical protein